MVIASFEAPPKNLPGATEEYHKHSISRCLISELTTYSGTSKLWSTFMVVNEVVQNTTHIKGWDEYEERMDEDRWLKIT